MKGVKGKFKQNTGSFQKGIIPKNKGVFKYSIRNCKRCRKEFQPRYPTSIFCSKSCATGYRLKGYEFGIQTRIKQSLARTGKKEFTGFVPRRKKSTMTSKEYRLWRFAVFQRDGFTCQICKKTGGYLEAHHIKSFAKHPELRLDVNNGITYCKECHIEADEFRKRFVTRRIQK